MVAPPQRRDAHTMRSCPTSRTVHWGGAAQANVAINRQPTKAEGGNQKTTPAKEEQRDRRLGVGAHSDFQAGQGAPHVEDGLCTTGSSNLIRVQASIRRLIRKELDIERSGSTGQAVPGGHCYNWYKALLG